MFWKIQDICYQMGTKPFKIGGEMVEKNEHEVGNPPLKLEQISAVQCSEFLPVLEGGCQLHVNFSQPFLHQF